MNDEEYLRLPKYGREAIRDLEREIRQLQAEAAVHAEAMALVEDGYSVTWFMIDGQFIVTATRQSKIDSLVGIGHDREAAWKVLQHMREEKGV